MQGPADGVEHPAESSGRPRAAPTAADLDALLLGAPRRYTREEAAELAGVPLERARRYWRALGFANTGSAVAFTDADVAAMRQVARLVADGALTEDMAVGITRALGHTTARLASWQVDVVLDKLSGGTGLRAGLSVTEAFATAQTLLPELEALLLHAWRRQLAASVDRVLSDDDTLVDASHVTVGFADLVGFTRLSRRMEERDLAALVERFEQAGADLVTAAGARLVKTLGDEVLFLADSPGSAAEAALTLLEAFGGDDAVPDLRIGLATGLVIARMGDVFGTTVNLASRLTSLARPASALVDVATAEDLAGDPRFETLALWRRPLRGLGLVEPHLLRRRGGVVR
jgi:adenylate cyclase